MHLFKGHCKLPVNFGFNISVFASPFKMEFILEHVLLKGEQG